MSQRRFDLNLMRVLDAVVKQGSTIAAAETLGITQSAVSHALKRLRDFFGDPLFSRGSHGLIPTARAYELAKTIAPLLRRIDDNILSEQYFDPSTTSREVCIGMTDVGEVSLLPNLYEELQKNAPDCSLRVIKVDPQNAREQLINMNMDLLITGHVLTTPDLYRQWLFTHQFLLLGHRSILQPESGSHQTNMTLAEYCARDHVAIIPPNNQRCVIEMALEQVDSARTIRIFTEHSLVIPHLLIQHPHLIATVPEAIVNAATDFSDLVSQPLPFEMEKAMIFQYWHGGSNQDQFHQWLRSVVRKCFTSS